MAQGLISAKYLYDMAEAIRVKLGSESTITPAQMAAAISSIDGTLSGTITPSTDTGTGLITDSILDGIADAIRAKLDVETQYTPAQMADAILSITGGGGVTIVPWATGTDEEIAAMIDAAQAGTIDLQQDGGWAVGDIRTISIAAFTGQVEHSAQNKNIVITSFEPYGSSGNVLQFDFAQVLNTGEVFGSGKRFSTSPIYTNTIPALIEALPVWLKSRLLSFNFVESNGGYSTRTVSGAKLAFRSSTEITGDTYTPAGQGSQLAYYAASSNNRMKGQTYWTRSERNGDDTYIRCVNYNGSSAQGYKTDANRFAPFGCL